VANVELGERRTMDPSEARRREAPERRGGWGPQYAGLGLCPQKNLQKINLEIAYFSSFLQAEMVSSALFLMQFRRDTFKQ